MVQIFRFYGNYANFRTYISQFFLLDIIIDVRFCLNNIQIWKFSSFNDKVLLKKIDIVMISIDFQLILVIFWPNGFINQFL